MYIYIHLLYVQMAQLCICVCVCYCLLFVYCVIGKAYFTCDMHLCGYYVIINIFVSLIVSYEITTAGIHQDPIPEQSKETLLTQCHQE